MASEAEVESALAGLKSPGVLEPETIAAVRALRPIADPKLRTLQKLVQQMVAQRGRPGAAHVREFLDAGYSPEPLLEVLVGLKTMSNYVNHMADTPLDEAFADFAWTP